MISSKAYTEVNYIINKMTDEMKNKIPNNIVTAIQKQMDKSYYNRIQNIELENFKASEEAERLISVLYTDYIATDEERSIIKAKEISIRKNKEKNMKNNELNYSVFEKRKKVHTDNNLLPIKKKNGMKKY